MEQDISYMLQEIEFGGVETIEDVTQLSWTMLKYYRVFELPANENDQRGTQND